MCNWGWLFEAPEDSEVEFNGKTYQRKAGQFYTRLRKWSYPYVGPKPVRHTVTSKVLTKNKNPFPGGNTCWWWEPYTEAQLESVITLVEDIQFRRPKITEKWIAKHQDVEPKRKLDPGPCFNLEFKDYDKEIKISSTGETVTEEEMAAMYEPRSSIKKWSCFS